MTGRFQRIDVSGEEVLLRSASRECDIRAGEKTHRDLRPMLAENYVEQIEAILAEGANLTQLRVDGAVIGIALWRTFTSTYCGLRLEIDDLVTEATARSRGHGGVLLAWLERQGRQTGCPTLTLNSAFHRTDAHRFYARQGYEKSAFHFSKVLTS